MPVRGVIVIHGVGSHKKGEFLEAVLDPMLRFLRGNLGEPQVRFRQRPDHGQAGGTVEFLDEEWRVREVWWGQAFHPQPQLRVIKWGFRVLLLHGGNFFAGMIPWLRKNPWSGTDTEIYRRRKITLLGRIYDVVIGLTALIAFELAYLLALLLASVFYVLALLPQWLIFPRFLGALVERLASWIVESPGDQYALMYTHVGASSARQEMVDALRSFFDAGPPVHASCESLTVIAHSAGATVAFGVLSDPTIWQELTGRPEPPIDMTLFTVGSSLTISNENVPSHPMWDAPLSDRIRWVDLWARYDYIPHGPPSLKLKVKVRGPGDSGDRFHPVRVVNLDSPFGDHSAYWANHEEVVSRFVYEIAGRPAQAAPGQPETSAARIRKVVDDTLDQIPAHRRRIGSIALLRLGIAAVVVLGAGLARAWVTDLGDRLSGWLPAARDWPQPLRWLSDQLPAGAADLVIGLVALGLVAYVVWRLITLWAGALLYKEPWDREEGA